VLPTGLRWNAVQNDNKERAWIDPPDLMRGKDAGLYYEKNPLSSHSSLEATGDREKTDFRFEVVS